MIGLDTNVLVRYLTQDDVVQAAQATRLMESLTSDAPGFVSHVVLVELAWVLESCYATSGAALSRILETLLRTDVVVVDRADAVWHALRGFLRDGGDFSDRLIAELCVAADCERTYSFDRGAVRRAGMTLLG